MTTAAEAMATIDRIAAERERWWALSESGNTLASELMAAGLWRAHSLGVSTGLYARLESDLRERDGARRFAGDVRLFGAIVLGLPFMPDDMAMLCDKDGKVLAIIKGIAIPARTA